MSHGLFRTEWTAGEPPEIHHMDVPTAYDAGKLGMWLFLATEILLFGGLFAAFAVYHWMYYENFHHASKELNVWYGAVNTVVLLTSSLFAALAVDAVQKNQYEKVSFRLLVTIACGFLFLVIKYIEWSTKAKHGLFPCTHPLTAFGVELFPCDPGHHGGWNSPGFNKDYRMYFGLYYCMTGLHGLHVIIGMTFLSWLWYYSRKKRFSSKYYTPVEVGALYWHLVDVIWIYLFPLLYLVG